MKSFSKIQQNWRLDRPARGMQWRQMLPGMVVLGVILAARFLGLFQGVELKMLDTLLRWRPAEATDERILIVGVTEADIQRLGTYPVPDEVLADLLFTLDAFHPRAVGIDIYRDVAVGQGHLDLVDVLKTLPYVIGIEKIFNDPPISPPDALPAERVGFVDLPLDDDGFVRRLLLGAQGSSENFHFSLAIRLAETYLVTEGLTLENGLRDRWAMRFGETEFTPINPNTGSYVNDTGVGNHQILLNVRSGPTPFRQVSMGEVLDGTVDPTWVEDAIVLIGVTSEGIKDLVNSASVVSENPGLVYGVEIQAHATSQLVNTVLEGRPPLRTWPDGVEYLWIGLWGGLGMVLIRWVRSPSWYLLVMGLTGLGIFGISYGLLVLGGWWIPLVPTLVALTVNGLVISGFYLYDQVLRSRIEERQRVIEQTYNAIHNGPLQTLALLLRDSGENLSWLEALPKLTEMDQELRDIYEELLKQAQTSTIGEHALLQPAVGLEALLHEKLYEIYLNTLQRDFPGFKSIGPKIVSFEPLNVDGLSSDDHHALYRFLEEALCNVGKHAVNATCLTVTCQTTGTENLIQVKDNGQRLTDSQTKQSASRRGTRQAQQIAQRLGGSFQRRFTAEGTCCELRWPIHPQRRWFWRS
ncbi:CHASE2 domain-containing protein [Leptolyngbya sp. CCNP1308]|uniref:sensor histidine kinase n=1 Tax=Leptolyngbya sp. CCNP1308 TaxID=3110255 RepID=UPI002B1FABA2|nr:CHASE2 domain-containing protein [Leptolyngbya sp. CCNP1308]MEA5449380.1 CHASE2 domain-containing protein [Leptolyngbya sp. CCNP1308]